MIDFKNSVFKLKKCTDLDMANMVLPLLIEGERVISSYHTVRDGVVFTTERVIAVNVQGITGAKKDFTSLPYNKIQAFSVETAGTFDFDSELDLWFSGLGNVRFEFSKNCDVTQIAQIISNAVLDPENKYNVKPIASDVNQPLDANSWRCVICHRVNNWADTTCLCGNSRPAPRPGQFK